MAGEAAVIAAAVDILIGFIGGDDSADVDRAVRDINRSLVSLNENLHNSIVLETGATEDLIRDLFNRTIQAVNASQGISASEVAAFTNQLTSSISNFQSVTTSEVRSIESAISRQILDIIAAITRDNNRTESAIINSVLGGIGSINSTVNSTVRSATLPILQNQDLTFDILSNLGLQFNVGIDSVNQEVSTILDVLTGGINVTVLNEIQIPADVFIAVMQSAENIVGDVLDNNNQVAEAIIQTLTSVIAPNLELANIIDIRQADELRLIRLGLDETRGLNEIFRGKIDRTDRDGTGSTIAQSVMAGLGIDSNLIGEEAFKVFEALLAGDRSADEIFQDCGINIKQLGLIPGTLGWLFNWLVTLLSYVVLPVSMSQIRSNKMIQDFRRCEPDILLTPGDTAHLMHVKQWTLTRSKENLRKQGYTERDAIELLQNSFTFPPMEVIASMWFRNIVSDESFTFAMRQQGWDDEWIKALKEVAVFIPPVQDLITMAVREVFTPEIAAEFGQFEDFPPEFAERALLLGMSEQTALDYWAAHWRLPSENMGFEMLHRDIIDERQLRFLMKALDIMPGWVDDLIALSFNPITRVDIRRIAGMGLLDRAEVVTRYRAIGYSPDDAELMTKFTEEFNASGDLLELDIASDLTRSTILRFYKKGITSREETLGLLLQAGINVAAAALFMLVTDLEIEERDRSQEINLVHDRYKFGQIPKSVAIDQIKALGLEGVERELALIELDKIERQITKQPTKSELVKFTMNGVINETDYFNTMELLGYSEFWSTNYLILAKQGEAPNEG